VAWWHEAVFYQIYPRSFLDTDGDGIGDLEGVRRQIPYLVDLGVDAIWLSPIYPSPMKDFGYDVSDYCDVDAVFGDLAAFDRLVGDLHDAGMRVILDWVPNHTSSQHPWFIDAVSSRDSEHREFYVWRDNDGTGEPPNNWLRSWSDESAWTLDDASDQYYLHCFLPDQPDLNWANVEVRRSMADTLRFWLRRGVDGFRMDVIHLIGKDPELPDDPADLVGIGHVPLNDRPETHVYLREIRQVLEEFGPETMSVGEVYLLDPEAVATYYGAGDELHLSFNFASLLTRWRAEAWRELIERTEAAHATRDAWPTWVLSNHDNKRVASRLGGDPVRTRSAMILLLTLRGTPFLYQGEELGLEDGEIPPERVVDPGLRDACRTPMPWSRGDRHGWVGEPWLPFAARSDELSVQSQRGDVESMLTFTTRVLALRRASSALRLGTLESLTVDGDLLRYQRHVNDERIEVVVNFSRDAVSIDQTSRRVLIASAPIPNVDAGPVTLPGGAAVVLAVD
jgi:alpha-glucosidase